MKEKFAKLIDVKSLMTLALTGGFIGLTCTGEISGEQFLTIFTMIVGFYFGTHKDVRPMSYRVRNIAKQK